MNDMTRKARLSKLSDTGRSIYAYMRRYLADNAGVPPTVREIADGVGCSGSNVWYHLHWIEAEGLIVSIYRNRRTYYTVPELEKAAKELGE